MRNFTLNGQREIELAYDKTLVVATAAPPSGITTFIETESPELGANPAGSKVPDDAGQVSEPPGTICDEIGQVVVPVAVVEMSVK